MPEEVNRIVTDRLADLLLTPSRDADENLRAEGTPEERIHFVGNVMIDTLRRHLPMATLERIRDRDRRHRSDRTRSSRCTGRRTWTTARRSAASSRRCGGSPRRCRWCFRSIRARATACASSASKTGSRASSLTEPLGYIDFLALTSHASLILTDSGGLQEESTALGIPCLTLRENTERPVTVTDGTNRVVGTKTKDIVAGVEAALTSTSARRIPELWDGHAADRIAAVLTRFLFE